MPGGNFGASSASFCSTESATATVFWPERLTTSKMTVRVPLTRANVRSSSKPSTTTPTSRTHTEAPLGAVATITPRMASTLGNSPTVRTLTSRRPSSK